MDALQDRPETALAGVPSTQRAHAHARAVPFQSEGTSPSNTVCNGHESSRRPLITVVLSIAWRPPSSVASGAGGATRSGELSTIFYSFYGKCLGYRTFYIL